MKRFKYFLSGIILIFAISCVSPEKWNDEYENIVPGPVSNVKVENVSGGAIITYTLPSVKDLLGVKAIFSLTPEGELMERWSSSAKDTIVLEGYGDTNERTATLYAVHKSGAISEGITVTINPLLPSIFSIRETLLALPSFGGIKVTWDNPLQKDIGISLYVEDSISHEMVLFDNYYSNSVEGKMIFRYFEPIEQNFRIEMFDRWQNYAQPYETTLIPMVETEITALDSRGANMWTLFDDGRVIEGDASTPWRYIYRCDIHNLLEDVTVGPRVWTRVLNWVTGEAEYWHPGVFHTQDMYVTGAGSGSLPYPLCFTVNMGRKAVYSRLKWITRQRAPIYTAVMPIVFDIWGCNDPKLVQDVEDPRGIYPKGSKEANQAYWSSWPIANGTDAWKNDWVKLASCTLTLSSGENEYYADMPLSAEDIARYQSEGWEFDFNLEVMEPFQYLRWEIHKTNTDQRELMICGLKFWGSYAD